MARLGDFDRAEEALAEALASAAQHWARQGPPDSPMGWLLKVGVRKAIDRIRKEGREAQKARDLAPLLREEADLPEEIADERLRLIFTCCHPALDRKSQVALTLRSIAGLTTSQIAAAFLDQEPTMGQRISRAKARLAQSGAGFVVPGPEDWAARLGAVLDVIYLIFNQGYGQGPKTGRDLCEEALFLARLLLRLCPDQAEAEGLLALLSLTHARHAARIGPDGALVPPVEQDRAAWDAALLAEAETLLQAALPRRSPGPFQIKAALAACIMAPDGPDWRQSLALYDALLRFEPSPVVHLNRAVVLMELGLLEASNAVLASVAEMLADYQPLYAVRAEWFSRMSRWTESRAAYAEAIARAPSAADALFLRKRLAALPH
ncbi:MAG TPA: sigma factor [Gemmobacter sp.]|nr:sigma factor [Gemmobacter sp.]